MAGCGVSFDGLDIKDEMVASGAVFGIGITVEGDGADEAAGAAAVSGDVALEVIVAVRLENPVGWVSEINNSHSLVINLEWKGLAGDNLALVVELFPALSDFYAGVNWGSAGVSDDESLWSLGAWRPIGWAFEGFSEGGSRSAKLELVIEDFGIAEVSKSTAENSDCKKRYDGD